MCVTWSWRTCILAFGFVLKSGCDNSYPSISVCLQAKIYIVKQGFRHIKFSSYISISSVQAGSQAYLNINGNISCPHTSENRYLNIYVQKRIPKDYQSIKVSYYTRNTMCLLPTYTYRGILLRFIQPVPWLPCPNLTPMTSPGWAAFLLLVVVAVACLGCSASGAVCNKKHKNDVLRTSWREDLIT
jgi:hypothetical protein